MRIRAERNIGLDIVRTMAIILVLLIHAIGFSIDGYSIPIYGIDGFCRIYIRRLCYACVPLFLILSGFLNEGKTNAAETWRSAFPRLAGTYLFWGMVIIIPFNLLYMKETFSIDSVVSIFNFTLPRAWYMNMYFGLLLLLPFINKGWNVMEKKEKRILLAVLFLISFCSKYLKQISAGWLSNDNSFFLITDYFFNSYCFFYYLAGAYIHDYGTKICFRKKWLVIAWQLILVVHTGYYTFFAWGGYTMIHRERQISGMIIPS